MLRVAGWAHCSKLSCSLGLGITALVGKLAGSGGPCRGSSFRCVRQKEGSENGSENGIVCLCFALLDWAALRTDLLGRLRYVRVPTLAVAVR